MMTSYPSINIAGLRLQLGLTQRQLANGLGISRSLLAMAETGRRKIPVTAQPILKGLQAITIEMPLLPQVGYNHHTNTNLTGKRTYNRVPASSRTRLSRALFVTKEHLPAKPLLPAMTSYNQALPKHHIYSLHLLNNKESEALINKMLAKKRAQQYRLQLRQLELKTAARKGSELAAQLTVATALLKAGRQLITQYPESTRIKKWKLNTAKLYYKKLLLEDKLERCNTVALVKKALAIDITERQLQETDRLIDDLKRRMEEWYQGRR